MNNHFTDSKKGYPLIGITTSILFLYIFQFEEPSIRNKMFILLSFPTLYLFLGFFSYENKLYRKFLNIVVSSVLVFHLFWALIVMMLKHLYKEEKKIPFSLSFFMVSIIAQAIILASISCRIKNKILPLICYALFASYLLIFWIEENVKDITLEYLWNLCSISNLLRFIDKYLKTRWFDFISIALVYCFLLFFLFWVVEVFLISTNIVKKSNPPKSSRKKKYKKKK